MTEVTHVIINDCLLLSSLLISEAHLPEKPRVWAHFPFPGGHKAFFTAIISGAQKHSQSKLCVMVWFGVI